MSTPLIRTLLDRFTFRQQAADVGAEKLSQGARMFTRGVSRGVSGQRGLTIVEIVVVLIILSVLMTFLVTKVLGQGDRQKMEITRIKLKEVKLKIEEFQLRYNVLPSSLESLAECNDQTGSDCVPIVSDPSVLRDAWERALVYTTTGDRSYQIKSLGADGKEGGTAVNLDVAENGP